MAARWSAAAFLAIEKSFRKIMGYRDLWALKAILDGLQPATGQAVAKTDNEPPRNFPLPMGHRPNFLECLRYSTIGCYALAPAG